MNPDNESSMNEPQGNEDAALAAKLLQLIEQRAPDGEPFIRTIKELADGIESANPAKEGSMPNLSERWKKRILHARQLLLETGCIREKGTPVPPIEGIWNRLRELFSVEVDITENDPHRLEAEDLIETGNILYSPADQLLPCRFSGLYEFLTYKTLERKYADFMRLRCDDAFLYKEAAAKTKDKSVIVGEMDELEPGRTYYFRIVGLSKESAPVLLSPEVMNFSLLMRDDVYERLMSLENKGLPTPNPVELMTARNTVVRTEHGYRAFFESKKYYSTPDSKAPRVSLANLNGVIIMSTRDLNKLRADFIFCPGRYAAREKRSFTTFLFSLKAVRVLLEFDPDLVFHPVYQTDALNEFSRENWRIHSELKYVGYEIRAEIAERNAAKYRKCFNPETCRIMW